MSNEALMSGHELDAATESSPAVDPWQCVSPIDLEAAARSFASARSICIDGFLDEGFAREIATSCPSYEAAHPQGRSFSAFRPKLNRCVLFETSEISYHGVTPLTGPAGTVRRSLAGYYYTREAPASWAGKKHPTLFRARPSERFRGLALMPLERVARSLRRRFRAMRRRSRE